MEQFEKSDHIDTNICTLPAFKQVFKSIVVHNDLFSVFNTVDSLIVERTKFVLVVKTPGHD